MPCRRWPPTSTCRACCSASRSPPSTSSTPATARSGVLDAAKTQLAAVHHGRDRRRGARRAIGDLPAGHGILGLLIVEAPPPASRTSPSTRQRFGFPPGPPADDARSSGCRSALRDQVFGNLYLTDKRSAEVFTDVDEELVVGLAGAAGVAIENARLSPAACGARPGGGSRAHRPRPARHRDPAPVRDRHVVAEHGASGAHGRARRPWAGSSRRIDDLDVTIKDIRTGDLRARAAPRAAHRAPRRRPGHGPRAPPPSSASSRGWCSTARSTRAVPSSPSPTSSSGRSREALSNVRPARRATAVDVEVTVGTRMCSCRVQYDDGVGLAGADATSGSRPAQHGRARRPSRRDVHDDERRRRRHHRDMAGAARDVMAAARRPAHAAPRSSARAPGSSPRSAAPPRVASVTSGPAVPYTSKLARSRRPGSRGGGGGGGCRGPRSPSGTASAGACRRLPPPAPAPPALELAQPLRTPRSVRPSPARGRCGSRCPAGSARKACGAADDDEVIDRQRERRR